MKRKEGLPIVVFNGDTEINEVLDIISEDFEGDIVINGNLIDSYVEDSRHNLKANIFATGDIDLEQINSVETLFADGDISLYNDFYVRDLFCKGKLAAAKKNIVVFGDMSVSSIRCAKRVEILGSLVCNDYIAVVDQIYVNESFLCFGDILDTEQTFVKHLFK